MRGWLALLACIAGCAESHEAGALEVELRPIVAPAPSGTDAVPGVAITVRTEDGRVVEREGRAALRFGGGVAYVDRDGRLIVLDARGREREIDQEVLSAPIASDDAQRIGWASGELDRPAIRALGAGEVRPRTIARAPGAMAPLALIDGVLALVGSANGGVAGLWIAEAREGAALECVSNCALRSGQPWGDRYVAPPADGCSIVIEETQVRFVAADGTAHSIARGRP